MQKKQTLWNLPIGRCFSNELRERWAGALMEVIYDVVFTHECVAAMVQSYQRIKINRILQIKQWVQDSQLRSPVHKSNDQDCESSCEVSES